MTTKLLFLLFCICSSSLALQSRVDEEWEEWKEEYRKTYGSRGEEQAAKATWQRNRDYVIAHNNRADVTFTVALNQFSDVDRTQRPSLGQGQGQPLRFTPDVATNFLPRAPPSSSDWRTRGVIPPVKNQGQMGYAAVFAVTDALDALHAIKTGHLVDLSMAELVDCCSWGSFPGQLVRKVFECVHDHGGLCPSSSYPTPAGSCKNDSCQGVVDATKTVFIKMGDESGMVSAVLTSPVIVYIDASRPSFEMYQSGVYNDPACSKSQLDHALLLVGYGIDASGGLYWILQNSWGADWGMQGYIMMKRGVNMCGIATNAFYPQ